MGNGSRASSSFLVNPEQKLTKVVTSTDMVVIIECYCSGPHQYVLTDNDTSLTTVCLGQTTLTATIYMLRTVPSLC